MKGKTMEPQQLRLNPKDLQDVKCEECGSELFRECVLIKKVSALLSPNGRESFVPLPTFACIKCNHVNAAFVPENNG
jgi:transcription elongation factor Elf1